MGRPKKAEALAILKEELTLVGYVVISSFQVEEGVRPGSEQLD